MINYSETYQTITPESCENGDYVDQGFVDTDASCTFREMVKLLKGTEPSNYPVPPAGVRTWYTTPSCVNDYSTGEEESRSYHPKTDRDARYMSKAWLYGRKERI